MWCPPGGWRAFYRCPFCNDKLVQNNPLLPARTASQPTSERWDASADVAPPPYCLPLAGVPITTLGAPYPSSSHPRQALLVFVLWRGFFSIFSIRRPATMVHRILKPQLDKLCPVPRPGNELVLLLDRLPVVVLIILITIPAGAHEDAILPQVPLPRRRPL